MRRLLGGLIVLALCFPAVAAVAASGEENVRDDFGSISYAGNDGSLDWSGPWVEGGESDGPGAGQMQINDQNCSNNRCLRIRGGFLSQMSIARKADLVPFSTARLSFDLVLDPALLSTGVLYVEARGSGSGWSVLDSFALLTASGSFSKSYDIASYAGGDFELRYRLTGLISGDDVHIDRVEVRGAVLAATTTTSTTSTTSTTTTTGAQSSTSSTTTTTSATSTSSTSTTSATTTTAGPGTSTTVPLDTGIGDTTSTTLGGDGSEPDDVVGAGRSSEPPAGSGLRVSAVGLMADYRAGSMGEMDQSGVEVLGAELEADFSLAVETFETARIWMAILSLFIAAAVVSGMDWKRSKLAKRLPA